MWESWKVRVRSGQKGSNLKWPIYQGPNNTESVMNAHEEHLEERKRKKHMGHSTYHHVDVNIHMYI
jgi:hypothetical protein